MPQRLESRPFDPMIQAARDVAQGESRVQEQRYHEWLGKNVELEGAEDFLHYLETRPDAPEPVPTTSQPQPEPERESDPKLEAALDSVLGGFPAEWLPHVAKAVDREKKRHDHAKEHPKEFRDIWSRDIFEPSPDALTDEGKSRRRRFVEKSLKGTKLLGDIIALGVYGAVFATEQGLEAVAAKAKKTKIQTKQVYRHAKDGSLVSHGRVQHGIDKVAHGTGKVYGKVRHPRRRR